jgi:hypothetical protein
VGAESFQWSNSALAMTEEEEETFFPGEEKE